jgi:cyanate permease
MIVRSKWVMLALVWLAYASFGLVSNSVAPLVTQIVSDLGISYGQMGTILGAWQLTYILVAYTAGRIVDRVGLRRALGFGLLIIALSGVLRGLAVDYWTMFLAVGLFGFGGPMVSIGAPKLIATWFQGPERGTAAGIYTTGPAIGSVLALATANSVLMPLTGSWRTSVVAYGAVALAACVVWWVLAVDRPAAPRAADAGDVRRLLGIRNVWLVLTIGFAAFLASHALSTWLPRVLQWHGYDPVSAGYWAAIPNLVGILGALTLPRLVPARLRTRALMLQFLAAATALSLIGLTDGWPLFVGLFMQGFVYSSITPFLMLVMMETPAVGAAAMGAAGGLYFTVGEVGGFSGPSAMGILFDLTGGFALGLVGVAGLMIVMGLACLKLERSG